VEIPDLSDSHSDLPFGSSIGFPFGSFIGFPNRVLFVCFSSRVSCDCIRLACDFLPKALCWSPQIRAFEGACCSPDTAVLLWLLTALILILTYSRTLEEPSPWQGLVLQSRCKTRLRHYSMRGHSGSHLLPYPGRTRFCHATTFF